MSQNTETESSSRTDPGLDGLPKKDREETEQILNEIDGEAKKPLEAEKPKDEKSEEEKSKIDEKPKDEAKKSEEDKKPPQRREVKLIPAFIHETAKSQWQKREGELLAAIESAKQGTTEKKEDISMEGKPVTTAIDPKKIEAVANEHGITTELARDLIELAAESAGKLSPEVVKQLAEIGEFRNQQAIAAELTAFNADFDKDIVPLIKAEYGDDVSPDVIENMREQVKELAYKPEFQNVPYDVLYRGNTQFRDVIAPKKKGAEGARGGHTQAVDATKGDEGDVDLSKPLNDEQLRGLTDAQFEVYEKNMAKMEQDSRKNQ